MNLLERLYQSEIIAEIKTSYRHDRPYHWLIGSPFDNSSGAFGEAASIAEAEANMTKWAVKLFPNSNFADSLKETA